MKRSNGSRWPAVGVIWAVVVLLTGFNLHLVNQVHARRTAAQTLQMDLGFLDTHRAGIEEVQRQHRRLVHWVASFGLGYVVVENDLKRLCADFGLSQVRIEAENDVHSGRDAVVSVTAAGPVPAMAGWLATVEENYPYLKVRGLEITYDQRNHQGRLEVSFNYQFSVLAPELS